MNLKKQTTPNPLPRKTLIQGIDFRKFLLRIDMPNWNAMMKAGLQYGKVTEFINTAIKEKLERDRKAQQ